MDIRPEPRRTYVSVPRVLSDTAKALGRYYEVAYLEPEGDGEPDDTSAIENLLFKSDIIFTSIASTYSQVFCFREELCVEVPIALSVLGNLPGGGTAIRNIAPFLRRPS